jgi:hypothetical protein
VLGRESPYYWRHLQEQVILLLSRIVPFPSHRSKRFLSHQYVYRSYLCKKGRKRLSFSSPPCCFTNVQLNPNKSTALPNQLRSSFSDILPHRSILVKTYWLFSPNQSSTMWKINFETCIFTPVTPRGLVSTTLKALGFVLSYKGLMPLLFLTNTLLSTCVYFFKKLPEY